MIPVTPEWIKKDNLFCNVNNIIKCKDSLVMKILLGDMHNDQRM